MKSLQSKQKRYFMVNDGVYSAYWLGTNRFLSSVAVEFLSACNVREACKCAVVLQVCRQVLHLPSGVTVISACVAMGQLSSSSTYPACTSSYLLTTACSDNTVRLWTCSLQHSPTGFSDECFWSQVTNSSAIPMPGTCELMQSFVFILLFNHVYYWQ